MEKSRSCRYSLLGLRRRLGTGCESACIFFSVGDGVGGKVTRGTKTNYCIKPRLLVHSLWVELSLFLRSISSMSDHAFRNLCRELILKC